MQFESRVPPTYTYSYFVLGVKHIILYKAVAGESEPARTHTHAYIHTQTQP